MSKEKIEQKALMEQITMFHRELCSLQTGFMTMISVSVGGYGLILYYMVHDEANNQGRIDSFYLVLPFLFFLSFFNIIKHTSKMLGLGAYVRHLEGRINQQHGKAVYQWYSYLIHANGYGWLGGLAQMPCFVAIGIFISKDFFELVFQKPIVEVWVFLSMYFLQIILLVLMLIQCLLQPMIVESWSRDISNNYSEKNKFSTRRFGIDVAWKYYTKNKELYTLGK